MTAGRHGDDNDPRLLTGAYALDAVTAEEAEAFDRAAAGRRVSDRSQQVVHGEQDPGPLLAPDMVD